MLAEGANEAAAGAREAKPYNPGATAPEGSLPIVCLGLGLSMVGMGRFWCSKVLFSAFKRVVGLLVALPADAVNLGYNIAIQLRHRPSVSPGHCT